MSQKYIRYILEELKKLDKITKARWNGIEQLYKDNYDIHTNFLESGLMITIILEILVLLIKENI